MTAPAYQSARGAFTRDFSAAAQRTLDQLRRRFPGAFREVKPLKLGITQDIMARSNLSEGELTHFMTFYADTPAYLHASAQPGAVRYDLDGNPVAPVSDENRCYAGQRLDDLYADRQTQARFLAFRAALLEPVVIREEDRP